MSQRRRNKRGHDPYMDVWHRSEHLSRYVGKFRAQWMHQIDIDSCEYCHLCSEPVALIETKNVEAVTKAGTVTTLLAGRAHLDFYLVEYELKQPLHECTECGAAQEVQGQGIVRFFVTDELLDRRQMDPQEYAEWLWSLRIPHWQSSCSNPAAPRMLTKYAA
jgi:hypothetical protein